MNNQTNWISVESRLPDQGQTVLIAFGPTRTITLATHSLRSEYQWIDPIYGKKAYSPDFWMPLPEAPPKPDPFEEWWKSEVTSPGATACNITGSAKEWCRLAWRQALKSKEYA